MSISKTIAQLKFRFDLGSFPLGFINFALLLVAISGNVVEFFNINIAHAQLIFAIGSIFAGFFGILFLGQIMIWARYQENYSDELNIRNPIYDKIFKELAEIKERLK